MRFSVLGALQVADRSETVELRPSKLTSLLAALLVRPNQPAGPEFLHAVVWDGDAPDQAKAAVQTYVMRLRKLFRDFGLSDEVVTTTASGYLLAVNPSSLDLLDFRTRVRDALATDDVDERRGRLADALAVWSTPPTACDPLPNVASDAVHRDHVPLLVEEWKHAVELRLDLELRVGRCRDSVGELRELLHRYPTHERFAAQLIEALYRTGRQHEALGEYRRVRERLCDELGVDPGAELRGLEVRMLRGEPLDEPATSPPATSPRETSGTSAATSSVASVLRLVADEPSTAQSRTCGSRTVEPRTALPSVVPHFAGRERELTRLVEQLDPERGRQIAVITGPPGVGKSALAIAAAHRLAPRFPGGVVYRASWDDPTTDSSSDGAPRLVVLEDPPGYDEVVPLLSGGPRSAAIVTGRTTMLRLVARHATLALRLQPLTVEDAVSVLIRLLGHAITDDPASARRLAELCGYFPAALVIAASRLRLSRDDRLAEFVRWLADDPVRKLSTSSDETMSVRRLVGGHLLRQNASVVDAFVRLSALDGDVDGLAAARLLGRCEADAEDLLEHLVECGLLEADSGGRYVLHDLLRAVGRSLPRALHPAARPARRTAPPAVPPELAASG